MSTPRNLWMLTPTEHRVLELVAAGYSNKGIRQIMIWAEGSHPRHPNHSVENRLNIVYRKLGIGDGVSKRVVAALMYLDMESPFASRLEKPFTEEGHGDG